MRRSLPLALAGCVTLSESGPPPDLPPPGAPLVADTATETGADTAEHTGEDDPGPDWSLTDEPRGARGQGALLVLAEDALWRVDVEEDGPLVSRVAEAVGYSRLNAADGFAVLRDAEGLGLAVVDVESGATLGTATLSVEATDALFYCDRLWAMDGASLELVTLDLATGETASVTWAAYGAELRAERETVYLSYWTGEGRGAPDEVAVIPCAAEPPARHFTLTLGESSRHAVHEGLWGAGRVQGYEGYDPYQISLVELDAATGEQRWSWLSDEDYALAAYAALPGVLHVASAGRDVWEPRELGEKEVWAVQSGERTARRVLDRSCEALALAPRVDGNATLWCLEGGLSQATLVDAGDGTWAGAPAEEIFAAALDMVWMR